MLGLDPDPARLWPRAVELAGTAAATTSRAAMAVAAHCALVLEAAGEHCVAVKLQVACFERLGAPGWAALQEVARRAGERDLLVIADAKRGDIDVTTTAYAQAFLGETPTPFGPVAGLGADALTVNPLLGRDSLAPLVQAASAGGGGLFVLVRTSNPGAAEIQDLALARGGTVATQLATIVDELGRPGIGASGLSNVGAVVGATAVEQLAGLREAMPSAPFLLPGIGPQGGRLGSLGPAFAPGRAGGLLAASRAIVHAHEEAGGDPAAAARARAAELRELTWNLSA